VHDKIQGFKNYVDGAIWQQQLGDTAGKILIISIHDQHLKAVQDGVVLMESDVATGRPSLPTPLGMYHIMNRRSPYEMVSPWPRGSPYYYNPSWVKYAMEFRDGGYFIHDAPWRTVWGPGANTSAGTHGCINVPLDHMTWIWNWAPVGTALAVVD
jgi:lipoprotein-anchoring transpeptidase ErfK/SrfK